MSNEMDKERIEHYLKNRPKKEVIGVFLENISKKRAKELSDKITAEYEKDVETCGILSAGKIFGKRKCI